MSTSQPGREETPLASLGISLAPAEEGARAPRPVVSGAWRSWRVLVVAGTALLAVLSAFLPWASVLFFSVSGMQGDGRFVLVFGLAGLAALALAGRRPKAFCVVEAILGLAVAVVGIVDFTRIEQIIHGSSSDGFDLSGVASAGGGLYLAIIAGIAWAVAAGLSWPRARRQAPRESAAPVETSSAVVTGETADLAVSQAAASAAAPGASSRAFCTACGVRIGAGANFCVSCGAATRAA